MMIKFKEFLKEFNLINLFRNNWQIKLLSVLLAFVLWFFICEYVDPDTTTWASDINISVNYEGSVPQKENLGIMTVVDQKVDVRVSGSRDTIALMNRQKITATLDLSNVTQSGEYDLPVLVDLGNQNLTKVEQSIDTVRVRFDTNKVSNVKVNVKVEGKVPDGLIREDPIMLNNYIVVTGPASIVDTIVSAEVEIKQDSFVQTGNFKCDYVFVDKDGAVVEKTFLLIDDNMKTLDITVPVVKEKVVPLSVEIINSSGGSDSLFCTAVVLPKEIKISGSAETLDSYNAISLGTIDVAEKHENFETSMAIVLPNGVKNVDGIEDAKVSIQFNDVQTRSFEVENIELHNVPNGIKANVSEKKLTIKVRGIAEDIIKLNAKNITLVVDYAQADAAKGTKRMNAVVVFPKELKVGAVGKYQLTVVS